MKNYYFILLIICFLFVNSHTSSMFSSEISDKVIVLLNYAVYYDYKADSIFNAAVSGSTGEQLIKLICDFINVYPNSKSINLLVKIVDNIKTTLFNQKNNNNLDESKNNNNDEYDNYDDYDNCDDYDDCDYCDDYDDCDYYDDYDYYDDHKIVKNEYKNYDYNEEHNNNFYDD